MNKNSCLGFTLIEVSIVIAIIATIVGVTLVGKSILTNSRLQRVIMDANSYTTAAVNFKQTYQMLPGDFSQAQATWGIDSNCTGTFFPSLTGLGAGGGGSGTCNGDGNGEIYSWNSAENSLFWQHLYLAGMYTGPSTDCVANQATSPPTCYGTSQNATFLNDNTVIGYNAPAGSIRGSGWSVLWVGTVTSGSVANGDAFVTSTDTTPTITSNYGNVLFFGTSDVYVVYGNAVDYNITRDPIIRPDQAAQIDAKVDDGLPASGMVRAPLPGAWDAPNCTIASNPSTLPLLASTSTYNLTDTNPDCSLMFVMGF